MYVKSGMYENNQNVHCLQYFKRDFNFFVKTHCVTTGNLTYMSSKYAVPGRIREKTPLSSDSGPEKVVPLKPLKAKRKKSLCCLSWTKLINK